MAKRKKKARARKNRDAIAEGAIISKPNAPIAASAEAIAIEVVAAVVEQIAAAVSGDDANEKDKRASPRVALAVEIDLASESHFFAGLSGDLSEGGVFVETYRAIPIGSAVELEFSLPNGSVSTRGSVRWHRDASESSSPGVGIAFEDLPTRERDVVHAFCKARAPLYYDVEEAS